MKTENPKPKIPTLKPGHFMRLDLCAKFYALRDQEPKEAFQAMISSRDGYANAAQAIREMMMISHGGSYMAGWWHDKSTGELLDQAYQVPIKIALIHSEVSEAMEADRKGEMDDKLPERPGIEVELADCLHRIFDLAGALDLDLAGAYCEKSGFNATRADHKVENRKAGGKAY